MHAVAPVLNVSGLCYVGRSVLRSVGKINTRTEVHIGGEVGVSDS